MIKKIIPLFGFILLVAGCLGVFRWTKTAAAADSCSLSASDFAALQAIQQNPNLSSSEELKQELAARKTLLSGTIRCATKDAQNLQAKLASITTNDASTQNIQIQLEGKINDAITYYSLETSKADGAGINGTRTIAKEIFSWRSANYDSLANQINNFILWYQNQSLFNTANDRLNQTARIVAFIEGAAQNNNLQANFNDVRASFQKASDENDAAKNSIAQFLPPEQSIALIQQSLQSLSDTYKKFFDLNTLIQTLLPTNQ